MADDARSTRQYRGVVFDLFHTLVAAEDFRPADFRARDVILRQTGAVADDFDAFWAATYYERETTPIDLVELVERFLSAHDQHLEPQQRQAIDDAFGNGPDQAMREPRAEAMELLAAVAGHVPVGVLSNCHERETRHLAASPMMAHIAAAVRSCDIGVMKPEAAAYVAITEALALPASECIYVGNGGSDELQGARDAGFAWVIHMNAFDAHYGLVDRTEQQRRSGQTQATAESFSQLSQQLLELLRLS